jgi:hypothetical protein
MHISSFNYKMDRYKSLGEDFVALLEFTLENSLAAGDKERARVRTFDGAKCGEDSVTPILLP